MAHGVVAVLDDVLGGIRKFCQVACGVVLVSDVVRGASITFLMLMRRLSLPKMPSVANAFKISDHQYNPR